VPQLDFEATYRKAGPLLQIALLLAREAGLRLKAIREFRLDNIDFENSQVYGRTKAYGTYNVPMTKRLEAKLLWACASLPDVGQGILQQFNRGQKPVCGTNIQQKLAAAKRAAGITRKWGMHDLRRTGARNLYRVTGNILKVQRFLGHTSPAHSWWYLGLEANDLSQAEIEQSSSAQPQEPKEERKIA
jgi:integrase